LEGVTTPLVAAGSSHAYYVYGLVLDIAAIGVRRGKLVEALRAEGVPGVMDGYQNVHLLPLFRQKIAYGTEGFPWTASEAGRAISYGPGTCPVAEELHSTSFLGLNLCMCDYGPDDVERVAAAFRKVWAGRSTLGN
jgi:dTDP-4-amino-4,6-dideoxygalactose transaminase